ncbi:MAG: hypothetical protein GDA56_05155 [Hormoscilla sp. GM7CHS1pb]|nr:hypothetical protein [Hormoscilla sp. GM7CHS1pb]
MIRYVKLLQVIPATIVSWGIYSGLTASVVSASELTPQQAPVEQHQIPEIDSIKAEDLLMPSETEILLSESWQFTPFRKNQKIDDPEEIAQIPLPLLGVSG